MRTLTLRLGRIDRRWLVLADWPWIRGMRGRVGRGWDMRCVRTRRNVGASNFGGGEVLAQRWADGCTITVHNRRGSLHLKKSELNESQIYQCKGMSHFYAEFTFLFANIFSWTIERRKTPWPMRGLSIDQLWRTGAYSCYDTRIASTRRTQITWIM